MNTREQIKYTIHRLERAPGLEDELEALRSLDALLADAVSLVNGDTRDADKRDAWVERAALLGYGPEDK